MGYGTQAVGWSRGGLCGLLLGIALFGCGSPGEPANVILITMDTTRADHIGSYGRGLASTPTLDSLSVRSTLFENAISSAPVTLPSHMTMMTGRTPIGHGIRYNGWRRSAPGLTTLAEELDSNGYLTAAFVSSVVLDHQYGISRGFDIYDDSFHGTDRTDAETTTRVLAYLKGLPESPLFLWVHYFDPHDPYTPSEPYASATRGTLYDAEISSMDHEIGRLLSALESHGYTENAHIIVVGDHGEGLEDRAGYDNHGMLLYEEAIRVPLLWHTPGQEKGRRDPSLVGCIDIYATALDVLGLELQTASEGVSLKPQLRGRRPQARAGVYAETVATYLHHKWSPLYSWQTTEYKYIAASDPELFDLAADPGELHNLAPERPGVAKKLHAELLAYMEQWTSETSDVAAPDDPQQRALLESLGYIQPRKSTGEKHAADLLFVPGLDDLSGLASPQDHVIVWNGFCEALLASKAEDWPRVVEAYETILERKPDSPAVPLGLAEALLKVDRPGEALTWLTRHLTFRPEDSKVQNMLGEALLGVGRYAEASSAYGEIPSSDQDPALSFALLRTSFMLGDDDQVRRRLLVLRDIFPFGAMIDDWEEAIRLLGDLGTDRPAPADGDLARQVDAMVTMGMTPQANGLVEAGVGAHPDSLLARLQGNISSAQGNWCAAKEFYTRALSLGADPSLQERLKKVERSCDQQTRGRKNRRRRNPRAGE